MVLDAAHLNRRAFQPGQHSDRIRVQLAANVGILKKGLTVLRAEDDVDEHFGQRLRHGAAPVKWTAKFFYQTFATSPFQRFSMLRQPQMSPFQGLLIAWGTGNPGLRGCAAAPWADEGRRFAA